MNEWKRDAQRYKSICICNWMYLYLWMWMWMWIWMRMYLHLHINACSWFEEGAGWATGRWSGGCSLWLLLMLSVGRVCVSLNCIWWIYGMASVIKHLIKYLWCGALLAFSFSCTCSCSLICLRGMPQIGDEAMLHQHSTPCHSKIHRYIVSNTNTNTYTSPSPIVTTTINT